MSADLLREAAAVVRREWEPDQRDDPQAVRVHLAVADWLDSEARVSTEEGEALDPYAVDVANAYLGRAS